MSGHTPGPWHVEPDIRVDKDLNGHPRGEQYIAGYDIVSEHGAVVGCEGIEGDGEANARLIAASPDLFEALVMLVDSADNVAHTYNTSLMDQAIDFARDTIRKAKGEPHA